jgi:Protein of unknown function (DUF3224)
MSNSFRSFTKFVLLLCAVVCFSAHANSQNKTPVEKTAKGEKSVTKIAKGTFEVKVTPMPAEENVGDPTITRLSLDKTWSGDLAGTSKGQMLGSQSETDKGTGGYVAMERFTGTLQGKKGGFSLQHHGTMGGGKFEINVYVVPGTGTGDLAGISGTLKIIIEGGKHFYEFEYSLPSK